MDHGAGRSDRSAFVRTADLCLAEQLLVWGMRAWVDHFKRGEALCSVYQRAFQKIGAPEAADHLSELLGLVAMGAVRSIDVRCQPCPALSDDEAAIIEAIARSQRGTGAAFHLGLLDFVDRATAETAVIPIVRIGMAFFDADQVLPLRGLAENRKTAESAGAAPGGTSCCSDPGAALIH